MGNIKHSDSTKKFSETDIINMLEFLADFIQGLLKKNQQNLARSFNFMFCYIDDVLSLNNSRIGNFVDRIYPTGLETKDTTDTERSASYIDVHLELSSEGRTRTVAVCNSQLIRHSSACGYYQDFLDGCC